MTIKRYSNLKLKRAVRVRSKITGTTARPRLSVFRSNRHFVAQLIDDSTQKTVLGLSTKSLKADMDKSKQAAALGEALAKNALENKITSAVFDRGSYRYHGRVKAFVEAARNAGLKI